MRPSNCLSSICGHPIGASTLTPTLYLFSVSLVFTVWDSWAQIFELDPYGTENLPCSPRSGETEHCVCLWTVSRDNLATLFPLGPPAILVTTADGCQIGRCRLACAWEKLIIGLGWRCGLYSELRKTCVPAESGGQLKDCERTVYQASCLAVSGGGCVAQFSLGMQQACSFWSEMPSSHEKHIL